MNCLTGTLAGNLCRTVRGHLLFVDSEIKAGDASTPLSHLAFSVILSMPSQSGCALKETVWKVTFHLNVNIYIDTFNNFNRPPN